MDNLTFQKIKDIILKNQDIAVIVGPNPNLDQMAAGLGFYLVLKQMGKNAVIACPTEPIVALSSLVGIDKVQNSIGATDAGSGDLTVAFPYREGEIEKVSYTLDNGTLNIVVKAGEKGLSFQQSDVKFLRATKMPTLIVVIGVAKLSDVNSIFTPQNGVTVVNIDNNPLNEKYGDTVVVDPKWSSVSEQVADFVTLLEPQIELNADTAQNLLSGINFATNDFTSVKTSYLAFEVAGILMKKGATREKARQIIQNSLGANTVTNPGQFFPAANASPVSQPVIVENTMPVAAVPQQAYVPPISPVQPNVPSQPVNTWEPQSKVNESQPVQSSSTQPTQVQQPDALPQMPKQAPPDWLTPKVYKGSTVI